MNTDERGCWEKRMNHKERRDHKDADEGGSGFVLFVVGTSR